MKEKSRSWILFQRLGIIIAVFASIATLIGLYYQINKTKPKLELQTLSIDYLTINKKIDNLTSNYEYEGMPVNNLWLLKLKFINNGSSTVIGKGKNQNIIGESIKINFSPEITILDNIEILDKNFPIEIQKVDSATLSFKFEQWREKESVMFSIYIKSDKESTNLLPVIKNRPILEGDIIINDYSIKAKSEKIPIIDYLPTPYPSIIRGISIAGIIIGVIIISFLIIYDYLIEFIEVEIWKNKYSKAFRIFLFSTLETFDLFDQEGKKIELTLRQRNRILKQPWRLDDYWWEEFEGKKFPTEYPEIETWKGFWAYVVLLILELLVFAFIILTIIKR